MNSKQIAKASGIKMCDDISPKENCNWDGEKFNTKGMREDGKLHELGHWTVSDRRHLPDFGLGPGPDTTYSAYQKMFEKNSTEEPPSRYRDADKQETLACVVEFLYASLGGHDMLKYMEDRYFIARGKWEKETGSSYTSFMEDITFLQKKKLISKSWVPLQLRKVLKKNHLQLLRDFKKMVKKIPTSGR